LTEEQTQKEAWQGVGEQFEALGKSLAEALRAAWQSEENRAQVQSLKEGLEAAVKKVDEAARKASETVTAERVKAEATQAAESLRSASKQTWEKARPHVVSALSQVEAELQKLIDRLSQN
jgi:hypothetical protein